MRNHTQTGTLILIFYSSVMKHIQDYFKFILEKAMKTHKRIVGIALLFL
jgi:hypothetical protein